MVDHNGFMAQKPGKMIQTLQLTPSNAMLNVMKNNILKSLLPVTLLFTFAVNAGLYKGLDDEGNVVYSDKPFENAQEFIPPSLTIVDAPKTKAVEKVVEEEKAAEFKYTDFDITSPKNNETLWNEPDLAVTLKLKPALNTAEGHNIWLLLNGKPVVENSQSLLLKIGRLNRGAHQLQAQVRSEEGKVIVRTRAVVMHIKQAVIPKN